jgi:glucokinase
METENMRYAAGIDVGGTFVKLALVTEKGDLLFEDKLAIGEKASRENILDTIKKAINGLMAYARENNIQVDGIGMGTPGVVDNGVVLGGAENLDGWENLDLSTIFSTAFGLPVLVENDANVMGLGESVFGAAKNCTDVLFFTVGTGIGGAMIINGDLYSGYKNRGAELGHFVIEHKGIDCNCGGRGCLEAYASTSALIKQYAARTGMDAATIDGRYIVDQFLAGEEYALACMNEHADYLGHGIASFINTFAPQKVVIGGGISESGQFYIDLIKKAVFNYVMPDCARYTEIVGASLGNTAGCLGAASLVFKHINTSR